MTGHSLLLAGLILLSGLLASGILVLREVRRQERLHRRVNAIHGLDSGTTPATDVVAIGKMLVEIVTALGRFIVRSGLLSRKSIDDLERTLAGSGMRSSQGLALFVGCKIVLMSTLPLVAWVACTHIPTSGTIRTLAPAVAGVVGLMLPDWLVRKYRAQYVAKLEYGLPDALDMMVICAQAGLGMGPAIVRVAAELQAPYPELGAEFGLLANELQISTDSRAALANMGLRTELDSLKRLGATLIQTIQYGTPLTDSLKTLAAELRLEMMNRMETKAARLPVLLTLPTVVFILPCVFLVAGGPAIIQISRALGP